MSIAGLTLASILLVPEQNPVAVPLVSNTRGCKDDYAVVERSLEFASRASKPFDPGLDALVAEGAEFELWDGDSAWGPRDLRAGDAARAFFKQVNSKAYVVRKGIAPICGVDTDSAIVEFLSADGKRSIFVTFIFKGSQLTRAIGHTYVREEGRLGAEAERG